MVTPNRKAKLLVALLWAAALACLAPPVPMTLAEETSRAPKAADATPDDKRWQAVAPGRVEPTSGEIKIGAPMPGVVGEVLVKANDEVFAGEPLIRLTDPELQSRITTAEAQIAMRRKVRNDENASARAATRRRAEDSVFDAEKAAIEARATLDKAALDRRLNKVPDADVEAARTALTRAQDRVKQQKTELRRVENDTNTPYPTQAEGQLNIARAELLSAQAALDKLTIRAPIAGRILQMNAKPGEVASPGGAALVLLGDVSALRVRAELDERDFGEIKIGQSVMVRPAAFRGREFVGTVSFIAPLVEQGRNSRGQRNVTDVDVIEVMVDLTEPGPLAVGMKVDVYFRQDAQPALRQ